MVFEMTKSFPERMPKMPVREMDLLHFHGDRAFIKTVHLPLLSMANWRDIMIV